MENYHITKKQYTIINYLYRFRFLSTNQLTLLMNHKDPRRLYTWLHDLTKKKIIGRIYKRTIAKGNIPAIYFLASKSNKLLVDYTGTEQSFLTRAYNEKYRSQKFIDHSLYIADMYLWLIEKTEKAKAKLSFFTKVDLTEHKYLIHPLPDAYIALSEARNTIKRYFVEVIDPDYPRFAIRKRIERYIEYFKEKKFQETTDHSFPSILIISSEEATKLYIIKYIGDLKENEYLENLSFYVGTSFNTTWEKS